MTGTSTDTAGLDAHRVCAANLEYFFLVAERLLWLRRSQLRRGDLHAVKKQPTPHDLQHSRVVVAKLRT